MNKIRSVILRKCRSLSRLGRSSSYSSLRSASAREAAGDADGEPAEWLEEDGGTVVFVGSSRRRYVISAKHLSHPLINALIDDRSDDRRIAVKCEVVLFDHLLWMLDNAVDLHGADDITLQELAELYAY